VLPVEQCDSCICGWEGELSALSREIKRSWRNSSIPLETQAEEKSCGHKANSVNELTEVELPGLRPLCRLKKKHAQDAQFSTA
jgi:hypothetical protein